MKSVLVICGATATGKTELAVECARALGSEIISADSQLIYKGLNIGTAKPDEKERRGVVHHMIDVAEPDDKFSVSDYKNLALPILENLIARGKTPVVCGGTGFYINSLLFDYSYGSAPCDEAVRAEYEKMAAEKGNNYLYEILKETDPPSAQKIHPNDLKRVIRALEIYKVSGRRKSELSDGFTPRFSYAAVAVNYPREELYDRIDKRVDKMFDAGLVEEVRALIARGINLSHQCMQAIGYKEVFECLQRGDSQCTMRNIIKLNTRHYAKRQITFFKKMPEITWIDADEISFDKILELLND